MTFVMEMKKQGLKNIFWSHDVLPMVSMVSHDGSRPDTVIPVMLYMLFDWDDTLGVLPLFFCPLIGVHM